MPRKTPTLPRVRETFISALRRSLAHSEQVNALLRAGLALSLAVGVWMIFSYSISEGILPEVSSVADAIGITFLTLCFALTFMIGIAYGSFSMLWPVAVLGWLMRRAGRNARLIDAVDSWLLIAGSLLVSLLFIVTWAGLLNAPAAGNVPYLFLYFFAIGLFADLLFLLDVAPVARDDGSLPERRRLRHKALILSVLVVAMSMHLPVLKGMLTFSFTVAGLHSNASERLLLRKDEYRKIERLLAVYGAPNPACWVDGERWLLVDAVAVWHGLGPTSFMRVTAGQQEGRPVRLTVPVDRRALELVDGENLPAPRCS